MLPPANQAPVGQTSSPPAALQADLEQRIIEDVREPIDFASIWNPFKRPLPTWGLVTIAVVFSAIFEIFIFIEYSEYIAAWLRSLSTMGTTMVANGLGNGFIELKKIYNDSKVVLKDAEWVANEIVSVSPAPTVTIPQPPTPKHSINLNPILASSIITPTAKPQLLNYERTLQTQTTPNIPSVSTLEGTNGLNTPTLK